MTEDEALKKYTDHFNKPRRCFTDEEYSQIMEATRGSIGFKKHYAEHELSEAVKEVMQEYKKMFKSIYYWILLKLKRLEK